MALDLSKDVPRSPFTELGGLPWLARLIDKVRAKHAGTLGEYTPFPCGGDKRFLSTMGLDAEALEAEIKRGASDEEVAAWVKAHQAPDAPEKLQAYRNGMLAPVTGEMAEYLKGMVAELAKARPDLDTSDVNSFNKLICVEEGHPIPQKV